MSTAQVIRGSKLSLDEIPLPELQPGQALGRVKFVAQNPTDVQSFDANVFGDGAVLGCDFASTVQSTGSNGSKYKEGDHVAGLIWGGEIKGLGAYAQHTLIDEKISFKVPSAISMEQAATIPLAATTSWLALFSKTCLAIPRSSGSQQKVLVWGGSSSVGQYAIQLARLSNIEVITVCSPKHFDLGKRFGASHVFDYRSDDVVEQIRRVAPDLFYVFDTIGTKDSSGSASQAVGSAGGTLCTVRPGPSNIEGVVDGVTATDVLVWTAFLKEHNYGKFYWPPSELDHALAAELFEHLPGWLESKSFIPNDAHVLEGLESVPRGFEMHRKGEVSGFKIVYKV